MLSIRITFKVGRTEAPKLGGPWAVCNAAAVSCRDKKIRKA